MRNIHGRQIFPIRYLFIRPATANSTPTDAKKRNIKERRKKEIGYLKKVAELIKEREKKKG